MATGRTVNGYVKLVFGACEFVEKMLDKYSVFDKPLRLDDERTYAVGC